MSRHKIANVLAVILIVILAVLGTAYGITAWRQSTVNRFKADNQQLQLQVSSLNTTNRQLRQTVQSLQNQTATPSTSANYSYASSKGVKVLIFSPASGSSVSSPVGVVGEVPGSWSSEAQFPVKLEDKTGAVIAQATGHVLGQWTTDQPVPFSAQLILSNKFTGSCSLVLEKDNPSGQSANQDTVSLPLSCQ